MTIKSKKSIPTKLTPERPGGYTKKSLSLEKKQQLYPDFVNASPRGLVPALRVVREDKDDDIVLWESLPVAEYIDVVFGKGTLMPRTDPLKVAQQQIWIQHCSDRINRKYYQALVAQSTDIQKECIDEFYKECRMFANAMSTDGPYFDGNNLTMVDIALVPFWQRITTVGPYYFNLILPNEEKEFQRLDKWWDACKSHPSIQATFVSTPRLISSYLDYSKNHATSDAAKNWIK